jgi:predicted amidohydrolase
VTQVKETGNDCITIIRPHGLAFRQQLQSHFWGGSRILGPRGELLAEAEDREMLITAELSRTAIAKARFELPTHRDADTPLIRELMAGYR